MQNVLTQPELYAGFRHCFSKRRYTSLEAAEKVARRMEEQQGTPFEAYVCRSGCGGLHVGHAQVSQ